MNAPIRRVLNMLLPALLAMHLLMVAGHMFDAYLGNSVKLVTTAYSYPLFPTPTPMPGTTLATSDCQLEFRAAGRNGWTDWRDASGAFDDSLHSTTEHIEQSLCEEFRWQVLHNLYAEDGEQHFDHVLQSSTYSKALYFIVRLQQLHHEPAADSIQIRLNYRFTPAPDQAYTFQRSYLEFPVFDLP